MSAQVAEATTAELEDTRDQLHAMECAVRAEFLKVVGEYAESAAWVQDGARDLPEWLSARFAMSHYQARETARAAEALRFLPKISEAFSEGRFSFDQLWALTRYATSETDEALANEAQGLTLPMIERRARRARRMSAKEAEAAHDEQSLTMYRWGEDRLRLRGELSGEWAAKVEKTLLRNLERQPKPEEGEDPVPFDFRLAGALVELCSGAISADPDPDRATIVLHTEVDLLASDDGVADLEGLAISSETARRLCCDGRLQEVLEIGGIPIGLGRTTRAVPPYLYRLLRDRDLGCRFPGCSRKRWVHAHHILHWVNKGPTDLGNLLLLCSYHHHFVHEREWSIRGNPMGEVQFLRPDGTVFGSGPPGLRREVATLLFGDAA